MTDACAGAPSGAPRQGRGVTILVARAVFITLVGYGGYLLGDSLELRVPWLLWALGGVLAGVGVLALEQAAGRVPLPRFFVGALGAVAGVLLAQLVASALLVFLPAIGTPAGRGFLSLLLAYLDRKSTRLNSSHIQKSRMPSSA